VKWGLSDSDESIGRLNYSFGIRRSSILKPESVGSRHGLWHHEDYLSAIHSFHIQLWL